VLPYSVQRQEIQNLETFKGETMQRFDPRYMPHENPCAQCGQPIAAPDWIEEAGPRRISYLWHCQACDYRFEAVAFFEDSNSYSGAAIAA
jgi:hypothetical protein